MRIISSSITFSIAISSVCAFASTTVSRTTATANLASADGAAAGQARFLEKRDGVLLSIDAAHLPPGVHGIHLHMIGTCTAPDFASAGAHWNPTGKVHGLEATGGAHMGDLPNLTIGQDGKGKLATLLKGAHIDTGPLAIRDADGSALVIHAAADDNRTDPSGNSGGRIACGAVK